MANQKNSGQQQIVIDAGQIRSQIALQAQIEAAELRLDHAPQGGRYLIRGQWVDFNGNAVSAPAEQPAE